MKSFQKLEDHMLKEKLGENVHGEVSLWHDDHIGASP